ncbi:hypothetical protein [uncultured Anoxybacillus sp.]|uniref:hypothetical protein n=1 Tax=uncultured Anoxybacillus sp. TaxID=263860 RepID=UPI002610C23F|nr:hypothetical protein [uncultured Anoxybacillus sp.]
MDAIKEIKGFVVSLRSVVDDLCSLVDSKQGEYVEGVADGHKIAIVVLDMLERKIDSIGGEMK